MKHIIILSLIFLMVVGLLPVGVSAASANDRTPARMMAQADNTEDTTETPSEEATETPSEEAAPDGGNAEPDEKGDILSVIIDYFLRFFAWWTIQVNKLFSLI